VLLYLGYTLVGTATLLYVASLRVGGTGAPAGDTLSSIGDAATAIGVFALGVPVVALSFISRIGRRKQQAAVVATAPQAGRISAGSGVQLAIVGSGALAIVLVAILTCGYVLPRAAAQGAATALAPYKATIPGPACDHGGAAWIVLPGHEEQLHCLATGLQITAGANADELVSFHPPGRQFPQNYRVTVQVDMSSLPDGCASIYTRYSVAGYYENDICLNGMWFLFHRDLANNQSITLARGQVGVSATYTIEATADGSNQRFAINGVEVSTVSDPTFTATDFIVLDVRNLSKTAEGSAVFSNFVFTPLP
jgi:hypothetical protein